MATAISGEGRITIPKAVRDRLGLETGSLVEFEVTPDGRVVLFKAGARPPVSRFAKLRGRAGDGPTTDQVMAMTRGESGHDAD
jgi:antitoxin PrlF